MVNKLEINYNKGMNTHLHIWLSAARPKTLWASIAPVIIGTAMAFSFGMVNWLIAVLTLLSAISIQIATNFANDYYDFVHGVDTRERLGPVRATGSGLVPPQQMKWAFMATFVLAFMLGLYLIYRGGWPILVIGLCSILFGILYTSGPYPLSYNGLGDSFVLIFFGPVAVGGTYYLQTLDITWPVILAGFSPGLISTALLTVNNLRDIHTDRKSGKRTLAVRFGERFSRVEYVLAIFIACFIPPVLIFVEPGHNYVLGTILVFILALPSIKAVLFQEIDARLNLVLAKTGVLLLLYSIIFSLGWII
jgi:1,4-dihydroxy-2-naphthoate octaprenyltransferase